MKYYKNRLTAALLALCVLLGLTACGGGGGSSNGSASPLSGKVYVPKFMELNVGSDTELNYVSGGCCDGKNVYLLASLNEKEITTDPETGEEVESYNYRDTILRVNLETGEAVELEGYAPALAQKNSEDSYSSVREISAGEDGTIWILEEASTYLYDLPENFDPETDDKWNYFTGSESMQQRRQLDAEGNELQHIELEDLSGKMDTDGYVQQTFFTRNGDIYLCDGTKVLVLDKDLNKLFELTSEEGLWSEFVELKDGIVGIPAYRYDEAAQSSTYVLRTIDKEAKDWGDEYILPTSSEKCYPGDDTYLFYYDTSDSLFGYKSPEEDPVKILSWSAADINKDYIEFFSILDDGRVAVMTRDWGSSGPSKSELAILTEADASELPERTTLTFATVSLDYDTRGQIIEFNRASDKYRIEIKDYSEYATGGDYQAALTKLNTEINSGVVPDILDVSGLPLRQMSAKGVLEDLWPFIDSDPDISRDQLMERVLDAASQDGKLYRVFDGFSINTVVGSPDVVGKRISWSLKDLQDALATMPDGCQIFTYYETKSSVLASFLAMNQEHYVDWNTGECSFDTEEFASVLEFCNQFPKEYNWEENGEDRPSETALIAEKKQMLSTFNISNFGDVQRYEAMFGGTGIITKGASYAYEQMNGVASGTSVGGTYTVTAPGMGGMEGGPQIEGQVIPGDYITYIGYPTEDGSCGSTFSVYGGLAMSTTCADKEGAWSFIRQLLLPKSEEEGSSHYWQFPVNKKNFDAMVKEAMTPQYILDQNGNQILNELGQPIQESKGGWGWDNVQLEIRAATQEEYDQVMELYNNVTRMSDYDTSIFEIVSDEAESYFNGDKSAQEVASLIQSRVNLYVNEQR